MPVKTLKRALVRCAIPVSRRVVKSWPSTRGRLKAWQFVMRHLAWQDYPFQIDTHHGFTIQSNLRDILGRCLYYFDIWEPRITDFVVKRLEPGDIFVDVGANIGYYSLLAGTHLLRGGRVVAVEASPDICVALSENLEKNHLPNVRVINVAAGDKEGSLQLFRGPDSNSGVTTTVPSFASERGCELIGTVPAKPLHGILTADEISKARIIKIDVEGAEWSVFKGLFPLLPSLRADAEIIIEVTPEEIAAQGGTCDELLDLFGAAGFNAYWLKTDYTLMNFFDSRPEPAPSRLRSARALQSQCDLIFSRADCESLT